MTEILDVDLLAFERGDAVARRAVADGVVRSLGNGFVFTSHDLPADLLDTAYGMLAEFFALPAAVKADAAVPGSHGQRGYTEPLVETAAAADLADWKEMLNWGAPLPAIHPLRERFPYRYLDPVFPEAAVPGISAVLATLHERVADLQTRFLRIVAVGLGADACYFDDLVADGAHLTRAIHYPPMRDAPSKQHVWADSHTDINLITALPRASSAGLQLRRGDRWVDVVPPDGHAIVNSGIMLDRISNGRVAAGVHRVVAPDAAAEARLSIVQFCHPAPWFSLQPLPSCVDAEHPARYGTIEASALLDRVLYEIGLINDAERADNDE